MRPQHSPRIQSRIAVRHLERAGFVHVGGNGRHQRWRSPDGGVVTLPLSHPQVAENVLISGLRQLGYDWRTLKVKRKAA